MEDVVEEKNGKQKIVSRKVMPGYIMVKMVYGDDIWHAVTRTRGITGFVGPKGRPLHLTEDEIRKINVIIVLLLFNFFFFTLTFTFLADINSHLPNNNLF